MSWMIGRNHCTVPTGRLNLGSRTNLNINYQKTTINNLGGGAGILGCGMGMYGMGGMYPMYPSNGADTAAILTGVGDLAEATGGIIEALTNKKSKKTETSSSETPQNNPANNEFAEFQKQTSEQLGTLNQKLQAALKENQELKEKAAEFQKQQQAAQLKKEGITINEDGSYTTTYKDITGKEVELKSTDLNQLRIQKLNNESEVLKQQKIIDENGITVNSDGTFSIEQSTQSENGNTTTSQKIKLTSNTLEGLLEQMEEKNIEIKGMEEENQ